MPDSQPDPLRTDPHIPKPSGSLDSTVDRSNTNDNTPTQPLASEFTPQGYEIIEEIGEGGMGVVYRARQLGLNREVAIKTVTRTARTAIARFWAEAEIMAAVKHPHVVQVFELGEHAGRPFMAMELADRLSASAGRQSPEAIRLSPRESAELLEKIARGVAAAHQLGIVHRDLKPGNVLLASGRQPAVHNATANLRSPLAFEPKVTDFGLAKWRETDLTRSQAVMGTPAYMAPEQAAGRTKFVGPPADVWALGVILYQCVVGEKPFDADTPEGLLSQIRFAEPRTLRTRVPGTSRDLDTIVAKCLTKEPEGRYATAGELAHDLARFLRGEPIAARPVGSAERLMRWVRRKPTAAAA